MSGADGFPPVDAAPKDSAGEAVWDDLAADAGDDELREPVVFQDRWRRYISHYLTWALSDGPEEAASRAVHWWASEEALRAYDALVPAGLRWLSRRAAGVHDDMMRDANEAVYDAICLEREEAAMEDMAARWAQWAEIERERTRARGEAPVASGEEDRRVGLSSPGRCPIRQSAATFKGDAKADKRDGHRRE